MKKTNSATRALFFLLLILTFFSSVNSGQTPSTTTTPELEEAGKLHAQVIQLYRQGKYDEALPIAKRVLALREKALGKEHQLVAISLLNLGNIFRALNKYHEAATSFSRAIKIEEKRLGADHPDLHSALINLGWMHHVILRPAEAEEAFKRAITIKEKQRGTEHPDVAETLYNLAAFYQKIGNPAKSLPIYQRMISIREKAPATQSAELIETLERCACALEQTSKMAEAQFMWERARNLVNSNRGGVQAVSSGVLQGYATHKEQPLYPQAARAERLSGKVLIKVEIDEDGKVYEAKILCGPDLLAVDSLAAARKWRFAPTKLNGTAIKVQGILTFNFSLH